MVHYLGTTAEEVKNIKSFNDPVDQKIVYSKQISKRVVPRKEVRPEMFF